ncbi:MAG TPA: hypothetical protein VFW98_18630 [Gemmatimonadaceae bacterium]|nr:hypothetical protein [Gemmatimonadaceae bacterium]
MPSLHGGAFYKAQTDLQYVVQRAYDEAWSVESRARRRTVLMLELVAVSLIATAFGMLAMSDYPTRLLEKHTASVNLTAAVFLVSTLALVWLFVGVVLTGPWLLKRAGRIAEREAREHAQELLDEIGLISTGRQAADATVSIPVTFHQPSGHVQQT